MSRDPFLDRWDEIDAIFSDALDLSPEDQVAFVARRCGDDLVLREAVMSLLQAAEESSSFLSDPDVLISASRSGEADLEPEEGLPERLGPYRVVEQIGRGGWGSVYLGERDVGDFDQRVAIKVLRRGLDTDDVLARFRAEGQILASLDHPNIARLLDGGATEDGRPYLVMELVEGTPITEYCDARRLTIPERLRLFIVAAGAVKYAHRNLVVHRDLKPANILVTAQGGVKLLDFGIAKLLDEATPGVGTPRTRTGVRPMTPEYASPEQVLGEPITTASDTYQAGLLLYELLVGRRPHVTRDGSGRRREALITRDDPLPPSAMALRGSAAASSGADAPTQPATSRRMEPRKLARTLAGDLDTIVLKALRREPERRYTSVAELIEDVERYLDGRPVLAQPDRWAYRTRKLVRRRPGSIAAGVAVLLAGLGYTATLQAHAERLRHERNVATVEGERAETAQRAAEEAQRRAEDERRWVQVERDRAEAAQALAEAERARAETERDRAEMALERARVEAQKAEQVTRFLAGLFEGSDPSRAQGEDLTVRQVLDRGLSQADRLPSDPEVRAELLNVMSRVYGSLGLYDQALPLAEEALRLRTTKFGEEHPAVAQSLRQFGDALMNIGDLAGAERFYRRALLIQQRVFGRHPEVANTLHGLGSLMWQNSDFSAAERHYRDALAMRRELLGEVHLDVAQSMTGLGKALLRNSGGDYDQAERLHREALAMQQHLVGDEHPDLIPTLRNLADLLRSKWHHAEAEQLRLRMLRLQRNLFGDEHPDVVSNQNVLSRLEGAGESRPPTETIEELRRILGEHPRVAAMLHDRGNALLTSGDLNGAEVHHREALAIRQKLLGQRHRSTLGSMFYLAEVLQQKGDLDEAEHLHRETLAGYAKVFDGADNAGAAYGLRSLGMLLREKGELDEAEQLLSESLAMWRRLRSEGYPTIPMTLTELGLVVQRKGELERAERMQREAVGMWRELLADDHREWFARLPFGQAPAENADRGAEELQARAMATHRRGLVLQFAPTLANLAGVLEQKGDLEGAELHYREALALGREVLGAESPEVLEIQAGLAAFLRRNADRSASHAAR